MYNTKIAVKRLKKQLAEIDKEIDKRIAMLEKMPTAGKKGYLDLKKIMTDKQTSAEAKFRKSLMSSGGEVWDFAWENVWDGIEEFQKKAAPETKQNYERLEAALKARQSYLYNVLKVSEMYGDQVWTEVWTAVWNVIRGVNDEYKQSVTAKLVQADAELPAWLGKQLALQNEIDRLMK